ncbi:unnamed protein product [Prunus brigantina]
MHTRPKRSALWIKDWFACCPKEPPPPCLEWWSIIRDRDEVTANTMSWDEFE